MEVSILVDPSFIIFCLSFAISIVDLFVNPRLDRIHELRWTHPFSSRVILRLRNVWLLLFLDSIDFGHPRLFLLTERLDSGLHLG